MNCSIEKSWMNLADIQNCLVILYTLFNGSTLSGLGPVPSSRVKLTQRLTFDLTLG